MHIHSFCYIYIFFSTFFFNRKRVKAKVILRKTSWMHNCYLKNIFAKVLFWFHVSSKLIGWNDWDQFQAVKSKFVRSSLFICYWGICFPLKFLSKQNTQLMSHSLLLSHSTDFQLTVDRGRHGHFVWLTFDTDQNFYFKINFLCNCQVLQGCLLFLTLDVFFRVTQIWYITKDIDFQTKFLFGMYHLLHSYVLWL